MKITDNRSRTGERTFHDTRPGELYEETSTRELYLCMILDGRRLLIPVAGEALAKGCSENSYLGGRTFRHLEAELVIS